MKKKQEKSVVFPGILGTDMAENTQFGITGIKGYVNKSLYPYTHTQVNYYSEIIFSSIHCPSFLYGLTSRKTRCTTVVDCTKI